MSTTLATSLPAARSDYDTAPDDDFRDHGLSITKGRIAALGDVIDGQQADTSIQVAGCAYTYVRIATAADGDVLLTNLLMSRRLQSYMRPGAEIEIVYNRTTLDKNERSITYALAIDGQSIDDRETANALLAPVQNHMRRLYKRIYFMSTLSLIIGIPTTFFFFGFIFIGLAIAGFFQARKIQKNDRRIFAALPAEKLRLFCSNLPADYTLRALS